jgi:hypothetical protein
LHHFILWFSLTQWQVVDHLVKRQQPLQEGHNLCPPTAVQLSSFGPRTWNLYEWIQRGHL